MYCTTGRLCARPQEGPQPLLGGGIPGPWTATATPLPFPRPREQVVHEKGETRGNCSPSAGKCDSGGWGSRANKSGGLFLARSPPPPLRPLDQGMSCRRRLFLRGEGVRNAEAHPPLLHQRHPQGLRSWASAQEAAASKCDTSVPSR